MRAVSPRTKLEKDLDRETDVQNLEGPELGSARSAARFLDNVSGNIYLTYRQEMGRPQDHARRREIAASAIEVLMEQGAQLPMSRLAAALGLKRPTLLYHFPSVADLAEAALESLLMEQSLYVIERMEEQRHPVDMLDAQIRAVHSFHHGREARLLFLTQLLATSDAERAQRLMRLGQDTFEGQRRVMIERIEAAVAQGRMLPCDAKALVSLVRSVVDGLLIQRVMLNLNLQPIHELFWERVLRPLKVAP